MPMSKCRKRPWNLYKYKNSLLKTHYVRNVPQVSSETSLPWLVQNKPSAPIRRVENKVGFLERQFHSEKLSFVHKKETEHSFELSLSICVFYWCIFDLEMQNFSLENHHMMNKRQPFCWWMTFTKESNLFLPSPPKWLTWPLGVCGGVGKKHANKFLGKKYPAPKKISLIKKILHRYMSGEKFLNSERCGKKFFTNTN